MVLVELVVVELFIDEGREEGQERVKTKGRGFKKWSGNTPNKA